MKKKNILMLGWEFLPEITGGAGVASHGIAEAIAKKGHHVNFLLPRKTKGQSSRLVNLIDVSKIAPDLDYWKGKKTTIKAIKESGLGMKVLPYLPAESFPVAKEKQEKTISHISDLEAKLLENIKLSGSYESDFGKELIKYALLATQVVRGQRPDIVHAHDWVTFRAGGIIKKILKTPLCLHVHSTEHDRNLARAQQYIIDEERKGFDIADHIFCVSNRLKSVVIGQYGASVRKSDGSPKCRPDSARGKAKKNRP